MRLGPVPHTGRWIMQCVHIAQLAKFHCYQARLYEFNGTLVADCFVLLVSSFQSCVPFYVCLVSRLYSRDRKPDRLRHTLTTPYLYVCRQVKFSHSLRRRTDLSGFHCHHENILVKKDDRVDTSCVVCARSWCQCRSTVLVEVVSPVVEQWLVDSIEAGEPGYLAVVESCSDAVDLVVETEAPAEVLTGET